MYAEVELSEDILNLIDKFQNHNETFEEIKELVFTKERSDKIYNVTEIFNLTIQFQEIKRNAINKALKKEKLNFSEGIVFERLLSKYSNEDFLPVEEHIKQIKLNCCTDRKSKRENERKTSKLYNKFITKLFSKNNLK